jgi:hypothetical protein
VRPEDGGPTIPVPAASIAAPCYLTSICAQRVAALGVLSPHNAAASSRGNDQVGPPLASASGVAG